MDSTLWTTINFMKYCNKIEENYDDIMITFSINRATN